MDSGCGFDREQQDEAGIGLVSMDERARSIGGRLTVHSKPGEGTGVHLSIPLRNPERSGTSMQVLGALELRGRTRVRAPLLAPAR